MTACGVHVVAAPDKFKGTASAAQVAAAISSAVRAFGATCDEVPMADGGEGTLEALGGPNRVTTVSNPLGDPVDAEWRLAKGTAVIEMARASGLELVGGPEGNDPVNASTFGTGELVAAALDSGAKRIIVGAGGSATTDGGLGALRAMYPLQRLRGVRLIVACDVRTRFLDAAEVFAPQKGATEAQVVLLRRRLESLAQTYLEEYGVDVRELEGSGAAGGLAGGLAAAGAELVSGFEVVADETRLYERMEGADLVITGEGFVDAESFDGKVVGGVATYAAELGIPVLAVAGQVFDGVGARVETIDLSAIFGPDRPLREPLDCVSDAIVRWLDGRPW
ncbi:MAG: glycerate kinase [Acidimicrobiales bacterium]|nr:glycerate kinase [Acidimicrobiales bacterium]